MIQLNNTIVNKARVVKMNRNSLILELQPDETIYVTRRVFNEIQKNPEIPMFSIERNFMGMKTVWLAIPMTL